MRQSMMSVIFLVLLLTLGTATAQVCKSRCKSCAPLCTSNKACTASCKQESPNWTRGQCQSFPPKCYCVKEPCFDFITMYLDGDDAQ